MKREFVPYELALKLKQLGFDEPCLTYYNYDKKIERSDDWAYGVTLKDKRDRNECLAPLFQQAFRWLRETHQIFPEVVTDCTTEPKFAYTYTRFFGNPNDLGSEEWGWENNIGQYSLLYRTYEDAQRDCLEEILGIIEKEKENGRNS